MGKVDQIKYLKVESLIKALNTFDGETNSLSDRGSDYVKGRKSFCNDLKVWLHIAIGIDLKVLGIEDLRRFDSSFE